MWQWKRKFVHTRGFFVSRFLYAKIEMLIYGYDMKKILLCLLATVVILPINGGVFAAQLDNPVIFNVDQNYDISNRTEIIAVTVKTTDKIYFVFEKTWWDNQGVLRQGEILGSLDVLSSEFANRIYPTLTSYFGTEWNPGIDGDDRITVLFTQMKSDIGGYVRTSDEYLRLQVSDSNEREMVYINLGQLNNTNQLKSYLAHEFMHLISFNQKERIMGVNEDIWLNELRADYTSTLLGYDNPYAGSNLEKRVKTFVENPYDSLTEWRGKKDDYGVIAVFANYLVDHYGVQILSDSLKMKSAGITSINEALVKNGFLTDFSRIFSDWSVAVLINDCAVNAKYCFTNQSLSGLRVAPSLSFLPLIGNSSLTVTNVTKSWGGNWQKVVGGSGALRFEFSSLKGLDYRVPYIIQSLNGSYSVNFLNLDSAQKGEIDINDFNKNNRALIIIPILQSKITGFGAGEPTYPYTVTFSITDSVTESVPNREAETAKALMIQITQLKAEIAKLQLQLIMISGNSTLSCQKISADLMFGMKNNTQVRCLQEFLKIQGAGIYPEGVISGNFLSLTKKAVIRFQEKHRLEILVPIGLDIGTGYVGQRTIQVINRLIGQ
ncbi:MAG: hypothetical protein V1905_00170 [bacterium]